MFLSKHNSGIYYIYYIGKNGKRTKISTRSKKKSDALKFLTNFRKELKERRNSGITKITLNEFINYYLKYSSLIHKYDTTKNIQCTFRQLQKFLGNPQLSSISHNNMEDYLRYRNKVSSYTSSKDYRYLKTAFKKAKAAGYIVNNPFEQIKPIKVPEKQPLFFTESDFKKLISIVDDITIKELILLAVNTGMRREELLSLRWEQVNFKDRVVILNNRTHITKSNKIRPIPLNLLSLQILNRRCMHHANSEFVFNKDGNKLNGNYVSKKFKKYVRKVPINQQLKFHSLRHTFASWLVQSGVSIFVVSKLMGHSQIQTTQIYTHLRVSDFEESVRKIENFVNMN